MLGCFVCCVVEVVVILVATGWAASAELAVTRLTAVVVVDFVVLWVVALGDLGFGAGAAGCHSVDLTLKLSLIHI